MSHGHTYKLQKKVMSGFTLTHASKEEEKENWIINANVKERENKTDECKKKEEKGNS